MFLLIVPILQTVKPNSRLKFLDEQNWKKMNVCYHRFVKNMSTLNTDYYFNEYPL